LSEIKGITFDFYYTLAHYWSGRNRGARWQEHLATHKLAADPWHDEMLYRVFHFYADVYHPSMADDQKRFFWKEFTRRLFAACRVRVQTPSEFLRHVEPVREIFGSSCLALYEEAPGVLEELADRGYRMAIISNWHRGLSYFCQELGILDYFDAVVASDEVGAVKPDRRIFDEASKRLSLRPEQIVHVGDNHVDDLQGAEAAGFAAVLLVREHHPNFGRIKACKNLIEFQETLDSRPPAGK